MNRTIKFRVWNKARNKWEHGPHENPSLDGVNLFGGCILLGGFVNMPMSELGSLIALQYTGLKDKNGREIFKGDIVKFFTPNHGVETTDIVCYSEGQFQMEGCCWAVFDSLYFDDEKGLEVVGNIFDNPELLK